MSLRGHRGAGAFSILQGLCARYPNSISGAGHKAQEMGTDPEPRCVQGVPVPLPEG